MIIPLLSGLTFKNLWRRTVAIGRLLRLAALEFIGDDGLKLSASLSYYTLFCMAPMLIIIIAIGSIWLGKEAAAGYLYLQFEGMMGKLGAMQLQEMINSVRISGDTPWVTVVGLITFFFRGNWGFCRNTGFYQYNLVYQSQAKAGLGTLPDCPFGFFFDGSRHRISIDGFTRVERNAERTERLDNREHHLISLAGILYQQFNHHECCDVAFCRDF